MKATDEYILQRAKTYRLETIYNIVGCSCVTKTPELAYHHELCTYRIHMEYQQVILTKIKEWENKNVDN